MNVLFLSISFTLNMSWSKNFSINTFHYFVLLLKTFSFVSYIEFNYIFPLSGTSQLKSWKRREGKWWILPVKEKWKGKIMCRGTRDKRNRRKPETMPNRTVMLASYSKYLNYWNQNWPEINATVIPRIFIYGSGILKSVLLFLLCHQCAHWQST